MAPKTRGQMTREDLKSPSRKSVISNEDNKDKDPLSKMREQAQNYWISGNIRRQMRMKTAEFQRGLKAEMEACKKRQQKKEAQAAEKMSVVNDANAEQCYVLVEPLEVSILAEHAVDAEQKEMLEAVVNDFNDSRLTLGLDDSSGSEPDDTADIEQGAVIMANKEAAAPTVPVVPGGSSTTQDPPPLEFLKVVKAKNGQLLYVVKDTVTKKRKRIAFSEAFKDAPQAWAEFAHKQLSKLVDVTS
ncbi:hypothetical protein AAVH_16983 [Aphelenchoides avenae]|nr:hypothetical protein AAVH_16983 [Aphelenchus avenae]